MSKKKAPKLTSLACTPETLKDFQALKRKYESQYDADVPMYKFIAIVYGLVEKM